MRHPVRRLAATATALAAVGTLAAGSALAETPVSIRARLGFIPLEDGPQHCSSSGIEWSPSVTPARVMQRGDAATPGPNAFPSQNSVPGENDMIAFDPSGRFLFTASETTSNAALTKLDTLTGAKTILVQRSDWNRLDPVKWYAPSGSLLVAEEDGVNGSVWQVDPDTGAQTELVWLGKMSHEGIGFGLDGSIWEGDENHTGAIFRAVPNDKHDLTKGGRLSALIDGVGFVGVDPVAAVADAFAKGATLFDRPEDFDEYAGKIYFTATEPPDDAAASSTPGQPVHAGGVYSVNEIGTPHAVQFVAVNDPAGGARGEQVPGLQYPDNLAIDRLGNVWIHEDIPDDTAATPTNVHSKQYRDMQDELWVALPDHNGDGMTDGMYKFANMGNSSQATPCQNEWTGGEFRDMQTFFVNQQHADNPTWRVGLDRRRAVLG
jgi:hypothetical protein